MAKEIERRLAALETAKQKVSQESKRDDRDTARRIHFALASSRHAEMGGAPAHPAAIKLWRTLQPNDVERLDLLRRTLVEPGGMDQWRPLCIERGEVETE